MKIDDMGTADMTMTSIPSTPLRVLYAQSNRRVHSRGVIGCLRLSGAQSAPRGPCCLSHL